MEIAGKKRRLSELDEQGPTKSSLTNGHTEEKSDTAASPARKRVYQRRSLFVRSLPANTTTESLIEHFSQSFPVKHATAVLDKVTKTCKGYGFVTFADAEDAQRAQQELNGSVFGGRKIKLEIAEPRQRDVDESGIPGQRSTANAEVAAAKAEREQAKKEALRPPKLIIRNLPWSIKKSEDLANLFRSYGKVKFATLPSKKPGTLSGFGFVTLRGIKNAEKALAGVNGREVDGRTLAVDWAVDKEVWQTQNAQTDGQKENEIGSENSDLDNQSDSEISAEADASDDDADDAEDAESATSVEEYDEDIDGIEAGAAIAKDEEEARRAREYAQTLFVRNLPFTVTDEDFQEHFSQFGSVRYARVVVDPETEMSKGSGFVRFVKEDSARECFRDAPRTQITQDAQRKTSGPSVLQNEENDPSGKYTIDGRVLHVSRAVDRTQAAKLKDDNAQLRGERDKDKRRLYLLSEGTISTKSALHNMLSPSEIAMREASLKQRKSILQSNPSLHLSLTRLSLRNIPRTVTSKDLKALAREAVVEFAKDVKDGKRQHLSKEELDRGGEDMVEAEKSRKMKGVGIVKQAKVVFESREGSKTTETTAAGRSRGYGFVEYYTHRAALMGLRWLNGHTIDYQVKESTKRKASLEEIQDRKKRIIAEFAIENAQVVVRRKDREVKSREKPAVDKNSKTVGETENDEATSSSSKKLKRASKSNLKAGTKASASGKQGSKTLEVDDKKDSTTHKSKDEQKLAKRQVIINKKRASRREKRRIKKAA